MRAVGEDDLPVLRKMAEESVDGPRWPDSAWERFLDQQQAAGQRAILLLMEHGNNTPCAWIAGTFLEEEAEVEFLFVSPPERRHGLGRRLLRIWVEWVHDQGASQIFLEVRSRNSAALQLYGEMGFVSVGRRRAYYADPVDDATVMRLRRGDARPGP